MKLKRKLPEAELEVMLAVWDAGEPVPRIKLEDMLREHNWNRNTINTYLARLMERGVLTNERRGNTNYYIPVVTREEYQRFDGKRLLDKLYNSSVTSFVSRLADSSDLSASDIEELRAYLDGLEVKK